MALRALHHDHARGDESALPYEVSKIVDHGLENGDGPGIPSAGHGDADGHAACVADVRVEADEEELHELGDPLGRLEQNEAAKTSEARVRIREADIRGVSNGRLFHSMTPPEGRTPRQFAVRVSAALTSYHTHTRTYNSLT